MRTKINLSLDQETADALRSLAKSEHTTMAQMVTDLIWGYIDDAKPDSKTITFNVPHNWPYDV